MPKLSGEQKAAKEKAAMDAQGGPRGPYQRYTDSFTGWAGYWRMLAEQSGWTPLHHSVHLDIFRFGMGIAILFWQADLRPNPDTPDDCLARATFLVADHPELAAFSVADPNEVETLLRLKADLHHQALDRDLEAFTAHHRKEFNENQSG